METPDNKTSISNWKEVIAHRQNVHLIGMEIFNKHLVLSERKNGLRELRVIHQDTGKDEYINFDEEAYASWISVNEEFDTNILRYTYSSLVTPYSTFDYNMETGELDL